MKQCRACRSSNTKPYAHKPPVTDSRKSGHRCTDACTVAGTLCLDCRMADVSRETSDK